MKHPPFTKRQLVEVDDDMEPMEVDLLDSDGDPMEVDPPLEDDLIEVDPPPSEHMDHHAFTVRPTRRDCASEITPGVPRSFYLCLNGRLDAGADAPKL